MTKLYEIADRYKNLIDLMDNEEIPEELIKESITQVQEEFADKAENIAKLMKNNEADIKALKEESKRLNARARVMENVNKKLKEYIDSTMKESNIEKLKGKLFTFSYAKNKASLKVNSMDHIPSEFLVTTIDVSKERLLAAIKDGLEVEGVEINQGSSLRIR